MTTFSDLGLAVPIVQQLNRLGLTSPFPIQEATIPDALAGKDILGRGPTGSGKTFAFGLPMIHHLQGGHSTPGAPRALVLVPTRELAIQVAERLGQVGGNLGLRILEVVGGVNMNTQLRQLAAPVDVLVATPGRLQDLVDRQSIDLSKVAITALDEADQMADMGFLPQVRKLLRRTPRQGQRMLFSATLDGEVEVLVKEFLHDPVLHSTAEVTASVDTMEHHCLLVGTKEEKNAVLLRIGARKEKTIFFMRTKHGVDRLVKKLRRAGIHAAGLHGDKGQHSRTTALEAFHSQHIQVLVATDIAARGIDIADVGLVVHVDPPAEHKAYLHRAGRTARAGKSGLVVTMVIEEQKSEVQTLCKKAGVTPTWHPVNRNSKVLEALCGARTPSGQSLPPFGAQPQPKRPKSTKPPQKQQRRRPKR